MKKNLCKLIATSLLVFSLVACNSSKDSKKEEKEHVHNYDVQNIEWFWKQLQNKDYEAKATFTCLDCKEEVEGHSVTLDATVDKVETKEATCLEKGKYTYTAKVTFQEHEYSATKEREYEDAAAHHFIEVKDAQYLKSAADCENDEVYYLSCEHCHETSEDTFTVPNTKLGHDLVHHDAKGSTCQEHGNLEYYQCSRCQKYFLTEQGEAVEYSEIELPLSHDMTLHKGTAADCENEGTKDYYTCSFEPGVKYYDEAGEQLVENDEDLIIPAGHHEIDGSGYCTKCERSFKEIYAPEDASVYDALTPITLTDLNIKSGVSVPVHTKSHIFAQYDFAGNKGIDLWFKPEYVHHTNDSWGYFYLFNKSDESGISFRFQYTGSEDGSVNLYIYSANAYGGATTVVPNAGAAGTMFVFPRISGIKSTTDNIFHVGAYCINESTNLFRCFFTGGIAGGPQVYPSTNAGDETNTPLYFDIELGADYFNVPTFMRFSSSTDDLKLYDSESQEQSVVYLDEDGTPIGKKETTTIHTYDYQKEGKQLVGWLDHEGHKVSDGQVVKNKTIVRPYFVEKQTDMIVPSDVKMCQKGEWFEVNNTTVTGETASGIGYLGSDNRVDMYFIYDSTAFLSNDNYSFFGFPYDFLDAKSRLVVRFNENNNGRLDGYIYGGSLGVDAKYPDNYFTLGDSFRKTGDLILVHLIVIDEGSNAISFTLECANLRTREVNSITLDVTFTQYSASEGETRNKMALLRPINCEWRFIDAF